jgi:hypothetical protein
MTTHAQQRVIDRWSMSPEVDRIDVVPYERGPGNCTHEVHLWGNGDGLDWHVLIGVATVQPNGEWEMHSPTKIEVMTIRPLPDTEGAQPKDGLA